MPLERNDSESQLKNMRTPAWLLLLSIGFAVLFMAVILVVSIFMPNLTDQQYSTIKTILALSGGCFAWLFSGNLEVKGKVKKATIKASMGFAVFIVLYFLSPAAPEVSEEINIKVQGEGSTIVGKNNGTMIIDSPGTEGDE